MLFILLLDLQQQPEENEENQQGIQAGANLMVEQGKYILYKKKIIIVCLYWITFYNVCSKTKNW